MQKDEKQNSIQKDTVTEQKLLESLIQETVKTVLKEFLPQLEPTPGDYSQYFKPKRKSALSYYRFRKLKPTLPAVPHIATTRKRGKYKKAGEASALTADEQQLEYQKTNVKQALSQFPTNPVVQRLLSGKRVSKENIYSLSNFLIDNGWINVPKSQYKKLAQLLAMINFEAGHAR